LISYSFSIVLCFLFFSNKHHLLDAGLLEGGRGNTICAKCTCRIGNIPYITSFSFVVYCTGYLFIRAGLFICICRKVLRYSLQVWFRACVEIIAIDVFNLLVFWRSAPQDVARHRSTDPPTLQLPEQYLLTEKYS